MTVVWWSLLWIFLLWSGGGTFETACVVNGLLASPKNNNQARGGDDDAVMKISWGVPRVSLDSVSHCYPPPSMLSRLLSPIPVRIFALEDVCLEVDAASLVVLLGVSGSGKSTLLQILNHHTNDHPKKNEINNKLLKGRIEITCSNRVVDNMEHENVSWCPSRPIMINQKPKAPDYEYDIDCRVRDTKRLMISNVKSSKCTLWDWIMEYGLHGNWSEAVVALSLSDSIKRQLVKEIVQELVLALDFDPPQLHKGLSELSPSGQVRFGLLCACLDSILPSVQQQRDLEHNNNGAINKGVWPLLLFQACAPILLLDELLDTEPSSIAQQHLSKGLTQLVHNKGAILLSATHLPQIYSGLTTRTMTLSSGKILTDV
eukprot:scaffold421228_cov49-Attheya_sp.AAC.4